MDARSGFPTFWFPDRRPQDISEGYLLGEVLHEDRGRANRRVCLQLLVEQVRAVEMAVAGHEVEAAKVAAEAAHDKPPRAFSRGGTPQGALGGILELSSLFSLGKEGRQGRNSKLGRRAGSG